MNTLILLLVIFAAVIVGLAIAVRFVKALARTIIIVVIIALVLGAGLYVLTDANDLRVNFLSKEKLLLLDLDGNIVAAVISKGVSVPVPVTDVKSLNVLYHSENYQSMLNDNYKLVVFQWDSFRDLSIVGEDNYVFSIDDVKQIMELEDPKMFYVEKLVGEQGAAFLAPISAQVEKIFPTNDYFRSVVFSFMIAQSFENTSIFEKYLDGTVFIYPETITLKLLKILPFSWVRDFLPD